MNSTFLAPLATLFASVGVADIVLIFAALTKDNAAKKRAICQPWRIPMRGVDHFDAGLAHSKTIGADGGFSGHWHFASGAVGAIYFGWHQGKWPFELS